MKKTTQILLAVLCLALTAPAWSAPDAQPAAPATTPAAATETPAAAPQPAPDAPKAAETGETTPEKKKAEEAAPVPQKWWQALVYDVVFKLVVPVLVPFLMAVLFWLARKFGLKLELETLDAIGEKAADYAEQKGAEWLKEKGEKSTGAQKEDWAWELVESIDAKLKGKEKLKNKLRSIILSKIPAAEKKVAEATAVKPKPAEG